MIEDGLITFFVLLFLEMVLSIDNIIFIAIIVEGMGKKQQRKILFYGLSLAIIIRVLMLLSYQFILSVEKNILYNLSVTDFIIALGGFFLFFRSNKELTDVVTHMSCISKSDLNKNVHFNKKSTSNDTALGAILEITFVDFVFSVDSILAATAITKDFIIISLVFFITVVFMGLMSSTTIYFVKKFFYIKILGLLFINIIGLILLFDGMHTEISKIVIIVAVFLSFSIALLFKCYKYKKNNN